MWAKAVVVWHSASRNSQWSVSRSGVDSSTWRASWAAAQRCAAVAADSIGRVFELAVDKAWAEPRLLAPWPCLAADDPAVRVQFRLVAGQERRGVAGRLPAGGWESLVVGAARRS